MMIPCAWNLVAFFDAGKWVDLKKCTNYPTAENPGVILKGDEKKVRIKFSIGRFFSVRCAKKLKESQLTLKLSFFFLNHMIPIFF